MNSLLNRKAVHDLGMQFCKERYSSQAMRQFCPSQVSSEFMRACEANMRNFIYQYVQNRPSVGKSL